MHIHHGDMRGSTLTADCAPGQMLSPSGHLCFCCVWCPGALTVAVTVVCKQVHTCWNLLRQSLPAVRHDGVYPMPLRLSWSEGMLAIAAMLLHPAKACRASDQDGMGYNCPLGSSAMNCSYDIALQQKGRGRGGVPRLIVWCKLAYHGSSGGLTNPFPGGGNSHSTMRTIVKAG